MDDDLDLDAEETEEEAQPAPSSDLEARIAWYEKNEGKLKKENQSLRQRLRRSELEAKYQNPDIVELTVESGLPIDRWADYAEKLAAKIGNGSAQGPTEPTEPEEAPEEEPTPTERKLAAVVGSSPSGASAPAASEYTAEELGNMMKTDPQTALKLMEQRYRNP